MLKVDGTRSDKKRSATPPLRGSDFKKYIDVYRRLLLLNEENNLATTLKNIQELLTFTEKVFSSPAVAEVFLYFCLQGSATAWVLQNELNIPEATVYRALKRLRSMGIVLPALKASKVKHSKGGPRPTVWAVEGASTEEVARALSGRGHGGCTWAARRLRRAVIPDLVAACRTEAPDSTRIRGFLTWIKVKAHLPPHLAGA